jgi:hypothetical protein
VEKALVMTLACKNDIEKYRKHLTVATRSYKSATASIFTHDCFFPLSSTFSTK